MNTEPLPHSGTNQAGRPSAAELAGEDLGRLLRGDRTVIELNFADACRYVGVASRTVDGVWRTLAEHLAGPEGHRACLWSNQEIAERAGVSESQARRALRVLTAFDVLDRQRRYNRSSVTAVSTEAALRAPPTASHARCDEDGCEGCALGDVQALLQKHFGTQVWMAGWADELALGLKELHSPAALARELTSNMDEVPADERVKVARSRLQYLIGKRGRRHRPRRNSANQERVERAATDVSRAPSPQPNNSATDSPPIPSRVSGRAVQDERATTKKASSQVTQAPSWEPRGLSNAVVVMRGVVIKGAQAVGLAISDEQAERWADIAMQHQLSSRDVRRGLFADLATADLPFAVLRWRLTDADGRSGIVAAAERFREQRREQARQRLARLKSRIEEARRVESDQAANLEAARQRSEREVALCSQLGEPPTEPVKALVHWLPSLEEDFSAGQQPSGMLLRRLRGLLSSPDQDVARQARRLVSRGLAAHVLGRRCDSTVHSAENPAATEFDDGRLFALD